MSYIDPSTFSTGYVVGAPDWNTYIRDNMRAMNRWTSYTPVWTASTSNPTLGNGILHGAYVKFEQWCLVEIQLTFGSTTSIGSGSYGFTLPFASYTSSIPNYRQLLPVVLLNDGIAWYLDRTVTMQSASNQIDSLINHNDPFTFGVNDIIHIQGPYRTD